jgi:hypothetical protein
VNKKKERWRDIGRFMTVDKESKLLDFGQMH